jgi:hypothetical protein
MPGFFPLLTRRKPHRVPYSDVLAPFNTKVASADTARLVA